MSGVIAWNYFSTCLITTSGTFRSNAGLFGKVYFPRIIVPLSLCISGLAKFFVQSTMFFGFYIYFLFLGNTNINPSLNTLLFIPIMLFQMLLLGLGLGLFISALTTKYRDLSYLITFGTQLLMYASPIVYPLSVVPENYRIYIEANPMTPLIEGFRYALIGKGQLNFDLLIYSIIVTIISFIVGLLTFNRVEKTFIDTV